MAAYDSLLTSAGQDKFAQMYSKYNDTMTALKAGTSKQLLTGVGAGTAPAYESFWEAYIVVGAGGGAPAYEANFVVGGGGGTQGLRFRRSTISDTIEITGRFERATSTLTDGNSGTVFTLPAGYRPTRPVECAVRSEVNFKPLICVVDPSTGDVVLANGTGTTMTVGTYFDITFRFPIS